MRNILILFLAIILNSALGQGTLIGPSTRNGSFEDGLASPWGGVNGVTQNAAFASHGEWFAVVSDNFRTDSYQNVAANPANGRTFILNFDARSGIPGFSSISSFINTRNADGSDVLPSVTSLMSPTLLSTEWVTYQKQFSFPESWDGSSIRLGIGFGKFPAVAGTTYFGYLDNITLQQIPEPASLTLLLSGGIIVATRFIRRRTREWQRFVKGLSSEVRGAPVV